MNKHLDSLETLIASIHASGRQEECWETVLAEFQTRFRLNFCGTGTVSLLEAPSLDGKTPPESRPRTIRGSFGLAGMVDEYRRHYYRQDPFALHAYRRREAVMTLPDVCDPELFAKSEYFQDHVRKRGSVHLARIARQIDARTWYWLVMERDRADDPFTCEDMESLNRLSLHLQQAIRLEEAYQSLDAGIVALLDRLDNVGKAGMVVDGDLRILQANRSADRLAGRPGPIDLRGGRLHVDDPRVRRHLDVYLSALSLAGTMDRTEMVLHSADERPSVLMEISPYGGLLRDLPVGSRAFLIILAPLDGALAVIPDRLVRLFGLTNREAEVATLLAVTPEPEVARQLGVSPNTLRTHRKNLYAKLGIANRADLAALLTRLC